ncbi:MAG: hypothetical protein ABI534_08840 [Chloroflexota bacterium]
MDAQHTIVVGTFDDRDAAERAIEQLRDAGFHRDQIGFAGRDPSGKTLLVEEHGNAAGSGAAGGLLTGAVAGGALAWLGLAAIPAIGPFLAGGAVGSALLGAAAGGVTGGVLGGLLGLGIPRHKAEFHEQQVREGRTLVTVQTAEPSVAERIFSGAGAVDVDRGGEKAAIANDDGVAPSGAFGASRSEDLLPSDGPVAVPAHEVRETDAYREAGVPATPEADVTANAAGRDRAVSPDASYREAPHDEAPYDEVPEPALREESRR